MSRKGYTIMMLPLGGCSQVRKFRLRSSILPFVLMVFVSVAGAGGYLGYDYYRLKKTLPDMRQLQDENLAQKKQIFYFNDRLSEIQAEMERLSQFNHKLKAVLEVETSPGQNASEVETSPGQNASEAETPPGQNTLDGQGGSDPEAVDPMASLGSRLDKQMELTIHQFERLSEQARVSELVQQELQAFLEFRRSVLAATPSIWPTKGRVSSRYGWRKSPFTGKRELHKGIDIANRHGTPIIAPSNGVVTRVGRQNGYGRVIHIEHGYGLTTRYAHLYKTLVKPGQTVKRGDQIAVMGNTGRSTGSHLHYEVRIDGKAVNPADYMPN